MLKILSAAFRNIPPFRDGLVSFVPLKRWQEKQLPNVHLFVGPNGSGKTRLLSLLIASLGNAKPFKARVGNLDKDSYAGVFVHWLGNNPLCWMYPRRELASLGADDYSDMKHLHLRGQSFEDIRKREMTVLERLQTSINHLDTEKSLPLANLPATSTPAFAFRGDCFLTDPNADPLRVEPTVNETDFLPFDGETAESEVIAFRICRLLVQSALKSEANGRSGANPERQVLDRLLGALSTLSGRPLSFSLNAFPKTDLTAEWGGVRMRFSQLPDGLRAMAGWILSIALRLASPETATENPFDQRFFLILDEPETHLHPSWQRKLIPAIQELFPNAQMFIATHSPFIISSVNRGWINIFRVDDAGLVTIDDPVECSQGDTYIDAVRDALGVTEWYDPETEALLKTFYDQLKSIKAGKAEDGDFESLAEQIGRRSESLRNLVGRELHQLHRQREQQRLEAGA